MLIQLDFSAVLASWPLLVRGVVWTIGLTIVGTVLGLLLGTACAWARARNLGCLLYTSPSPRDRTRSRMPSSA